MVHRTGYVRLLSGDRMKEWPEVGDGIRSGATIDSEKSSSLRAEFGASFLHVGPRTRLQWLGDGAFRLESGMVRVHAETGTSAVVEMGSQKITVNDADILFIFPDRVKTLAGTSSASQTKLTEPDILAALSLTLPGKEGASERRLILTFAEPKHAPRLNFETDKVAYEKHIGD